jgi:hypothetical protein
MRPLSQRLVKHDCFPFEREEPMRIAPSRETPNAPTLIAASIERDLTHLAASFGVYHCNF